MPKTAHEFIADSTSQLPNNSAGAICISPHFDTSFNRNKINPIIGHVIP